MYGCKKHKMIFEEFWDEVNHLVEGEGFCPKCVFNDLYGEDKGDGK